MQQWLCYRSGTLSRLSAQSGTAFTWRRWWSCLLVVAEGLALVYDDRKYALIGAADREIMITHDQQELAVTERHHNEMEALQRELEEAQREQPSLRLTTIGQQALLDAVSPFPGHQIEIVSILGDLEGQQFANDIASVAQQAGWNASSINEVPLATNPSGIDVFVDLRILPARSVTICEEVASEVIRLMVGTIGGISLPMLKGGACENR